MLSRVRYGDKGVIAEDLSCLKKRKELTIIISISLLINIICTSV